MPVANTTMGHKRPVVRCRGLTKHYGEGEAAVAALRGVDLDVQPGELLMLVGPSGCGKTTLVSIITAILDPDGGSCEVLGEDMLAMDMDARARFRGDHIGFVFQAFNLLPALSALDNVAVPLLIKRVERREAEQRSRTVLEEIGLAGRADTLPSKLSGGQQQRVAIGRALVHGPALIVCDEPTSSLDATAGHQMMELLRDVARTPERALIVVTHDNRIFDFADRIAHMEDGCIVDITANDRPGATR